MTAIARVGNNHHYSRNKRFTWWQEKQQCWAQLWVFRGSRHQPGQFPGQGEPQLLWGTLKGRVALQAPTVP